ncbi:MAG: FeS cluster assembly protein SufD [Microgenomates bacterium OLB23]|nr:MAG: FeS cluster assembly protein SufD [Microgenomates bacterium OLB23]
MKTKFYIIDNADAQHTYVVESLETHVFVLLNYSGTLRVQIQKEQAQVFIFGIYVGKDNEKLNIMTVQDHQKGNALSELFIRGVFFDNAKFLYEGLINIAKDAQGSNAYQKNQNLILSPNAFVDSRPFLEIQANDVRCTHGSTTGRIDRAHIEYLVSRGMSKENAQNLVINGFISEVFAHIARVAPDADLMKLKEKVVQYHHVFSY